MRVYELSKELNISNKQLLDLLQNAGVDVKSHMSVLDDKAVLTVKNILQKKQSEDLDIKSTKQSEKQKNMEVQNQKPVLVSQKAESGPLLEKKSSVLPETTDIKSAEMPVQGFVIQPMTVTQFAEKTGKLVNDVILTLLKWRIVSTKNQIMSNDVLIRLAEHYDIKIEKNSPVVKPKEMEIPRLVSVAGSKLKERSPIVVVLGHVDHGKTTLLDFIRKTRVASKEKGGITQHLGAYEAVTDHGNIVFLDTPGHEAFSKIRQRGLRVADIAILVVAADDGIMPQTVESIKQIKSLDIPVIVAINKIDKADSARVEIIKRQLAQYDILCEEWGGQVICVPISAKTGFGVDKLLEMIILQSQMMELRADISSAARGYLLEAKLEKGRGVVATLLLQQGEIRIGDYFVCGKTVGRITTIVNSFGKNVSLISPFIPVQISGFAELPEVGDLFAVVSKEEYLKARTAHDYQPASTLKGMKKENYINVIIKTDNNSSKEALIESIERLSKNLEVGIHIVYIAVGDLNESDIELAYNTGSQIIGLHIKAESNAIILSQKRKVNIRLFDIIYKLLEALEEQAKREQKVEMVQTKIGEAIVRRVFDIPNVGVVAGCYVKDGRFTKDGYIKVWRGRQKVGEGKITSLQREKKSVKEVHTGFECGFVVQDLKDWAVDDRVECYIDIPKK